jgi:hypothetical protein
MSCQKYTKTTRGKIWFDGENKITVCLIMKNNTLVAKFQFKYRFTRKNFFQVYPFHFPISHSQFVQISKNAHLPKVFTVVVYQVLTRKTVTSRNYITPYGTQRFTAVFTTAWSWTLSQANDLNPHPQILVLYNQFRYHHPIWALSAHNAFHINLFTYTLYKLFTPHIHTTYPLLEQLATPTSWRKCNLKAQTARTELHGTTPQMNFTNQYK